MRLILFGFAMTMALPAFAQDKVGIPICDEFLEKYGTCAKTLQPAQRDPIVASIDQMRTSWKQVMSSSPQSKDGLETSCKNTFDSIKASFSAAPYNCKF